MVTNENVAETASVGREGLCGSGCGYSRCEFNASPRSVSGVREPRIENADLPHLRDSFVLISEVSFVANFKQVMEVLKKTDRAVGAPHPLLGNFFTSSQGLVRAIGSC